MQELKSHAKKTLRCAIYTRKSTEEGLEQDFNSLDAQRESAQAFIRSQQREGWKAVPGHYDDGGFTGANMERPALTRLLDAVRAREIDCVVVYKVDRLSRSLLDFARIMSLFDEHEVSFVSVTQQFNTSSSLGRLTLHILLSFAQYAERAIMQSGSVGRAAPLAFRWCWTPHYPGSNKEVTSASGGLNRRDATPVEVRALPLLTCPIYPHAGRSRLCGHRRDRATVPPAVCPRAEPCRSSAFSVSLRARRFARAKKIPMHRKLPANTIISPSKNGRRIRSSCDVQ